MLFDKGKPLTKEYCETCKKEIKPGEKMIISMICPSHERQFFNRTTTVGIYSFVDNAPKYHENCYLKNIKKK